jgi:hypothetical protein
MANIHPIVSACKQIKGNTQQVKLARVITLVQRKAMTDIYLNKPSRKALVQLGIPKSILKLI